MAGRRYLERATLVPVEPRGDRTLPEPPPVLEALWHRGEKMPSVLVLPPSPDVGSSMDHVVCAEVAWTAASEGHASLRFNHRGVGASQGERGGVPDWLDDATSALRTLRESAEVPLTIAVGLEAACLTACGLAAQDRAVAGLFLVNPPPGFSAPLAAVRLPLVAVTAQPPRRQTAPAGTNAGGADPERLEPDEGAGPLATEVEGLGGILVHVEGAAGGYSKGLTGIGAALRRFLERPNRSVERS